ncbi:MAG: hypothetical protein F9K29_20470 [Hyphomicrobiaceae bacterium]|nr:MAG: hypothetical protein F9K29_20470 [Hyphomicrobiaceae bacterium]
MSDVLFPPDAGMNAPGPPQPRGLRLGDAETIAADRLDDAADGSLKEALADVSVTDPDQGVARLSDRIDAVRESFEENGQTPPLALRKSGVVVTEALDLGSLGLRQWIPAPQPEPAAVEPTPRSEPASAEPELGPEVMFAEAEENVPEYVSQPLAEQADATTDHSPAATAPAADAQTPSDALKPAQAGMGTEGTQTGRAPLASAVDAAAKLMADASAAAEALQNLQRLLQQQQASRFVPPQVPRRAATGEMAGPPVADPPASRMTSPPVAQFVAAPASQAARPVPPPRPPVNPKSSAVTRRPVGTEKRPMDVRGFMAGFALSCAIGAMLYIYLMAG